MNRLEGCCTPCTLSCTVILLLACFLGQDRSLIINHMFSCQTCEAGVNIRVYQPRVSVLLYSVPYIS